MLYLEDFLELIESFPNELKERLNEIRDLDSQIQTETDKLGTRADSFFSQCKKQKPEWKSENFENIRKDYLQILSTADDKVHISNQLNELIDKYLKKLDQEILKFKLELEADHAGITSKLEKTVSTQNQNNEDVYNEDVFNSLIDDKSQLYDQMDAAYTNLYSPLNLNDSNTFQFNPHSYNCQSSSSFQPMKSQLSSNLLRTSSVTSNISTKLHSTDLLDNLLIRKSSSAHKRPATAHIRSSSSLIDSINTTIHHQSRKKVKMDKFEDDLDDEEFYDDETNDGQTIGDDSSVSDGGDSSTITNDKQFKEDMNEDPTEEQRYCVCKDVSYGDMILCDNRRCVTQWFHFTCVGLNSAPKGKWFCPACLNIKKKKKMLTQQSFLNHSTNSNEAKSLTGASSTNDIYNDEFDFKFQVPKIINK